MSNGGYSRKIATLTLTAEFVGDYIDKDDVILYLEDWLCSGFDDRDNLVGWNIYGCSVIEQPLDRPNDNM